MTVTNFLPEHYLPPLFSDSRITPHQNGRCDNTASLLAEFLPGFLPTPAVAGFDDLGVVPPCTLYCGWCGFVPFFSGIIA